MLVFVVGGNGSNADTSRQTGTRQQRSCCNSARFQGTLYATDGIDIATTSNADGPSSATQLRSRSAHERQLDLARRHRRRRPASPGNPSRVRRAAAAGLRRLTPWRSPSPPSSFVPGLAIGSFLNVVAARVPRKRSIVSPGSACMSCGHELAWYENVPVLSWLAPARRCRAAATRIGVVYPAVELLTALLIAACFLVFGWSGDAFVASFFCATLVTVSATDLSHRIVPNVVVLPAAVVVLVAQTVLHPSPEWALGALRRLLLPLPGGARLPGGDGHGRRQARAAARRDARPHRAGRADGRDDRRARPVGRPASPATAARRARWGSRSRRSSRSAASSPCSSATRCSTRT